MNQDAFSPNKQLKAEALRTDDFHAARVTPHPDSDEAKRREAVRVGNKPQISEDDLARAAKPKSDDHPFVVTELLKKAKLYGDRYAVYGDNYHRFGPIFSLLMETQKLECLSTHDMARLGVLVQLVSKLTRYCENFNRGGHDDSLDDMAVYSMMLKELDRK